MVTACASMSGRECLWTGAGPIKRREGASSRARSRACAQPGACARPASRKFPTEGGHVLIERPDTEAIPHVPLCSRQSGLH